MQTQPNIAHDKNDGKTYREFSRRRYAELKNGQGKHLRESQIIKKIIVEWDEIQLANKNKRASRGMSKGLATPLKMEENLISMDIKNQIGLKSTSAKKDDINEERSSYEQEVDNIQIHSFQAEPQAEVKKTKKTRDSQEYLAFYKAHYSQLMKKHPNWTSNQATVIIKLRWSVEKLRKGSKKTSQRIMRKPTVRSGRMTFKLTKLKQGFEKTHIIKKWKRLPRESKRMWEAKGNPEAIHTESVIKEKTMIVRKQEKSVNLTALLNKRVD